MISPDFTPQPVVRPGQAVQQGVPMPDFGAWLHGAFRQGMVEVSEGMDSALRYASRVAKQGLPPGRGRGELDPRHVPLVVGSRDGPAGVFLVTRALLEDVRRVEGQAGLTHTAIGGIAIANTVDAVRPDFTPDAMNAINRSYFASPVAFSREAQLASLFAVGDTTNRALGGALAGLTCVTDRPVRVKELCSGARTEHWGLIVEGAVLGGAAGLDVTLTDFFKPPVLPDTAGNGVGAGKLHTASEVYSLHDDLPELPPYGRFDAMLETYGFDSVWLDGDIRLSRIGDTWYQSLFRVKVDDWSPRKQELLEALRTGTAVPNARAYYYEGMFVEEVMQQVTIDNHPWAEVLHDIPDGARVNVPTGLVLRIVQAMERQLTPDGVFIAADAANIDDAERVYSASDVSGVAERYKVEDWVIAKRVLERYYGIEAHFDSLHGLVRMLIPPGWEAYTGEAETQAIHHGEVRLMIAWRHRPKE